MAEDTGDVLRRSLDAVDRHRRRVILGLVALVVLLLMTLIYGAHTAGRNTVSSVLAHFFMLIIWVTGLTLVVVIQIAAATKRILRAIELASRK
jgi:uncharacterized membrane protein